MPPRLRHLPAADSAGTARLILHTCLGYHLEPAAHCTACHRAGCHAPPSLTLPWEMGSATTKQDAICHLLLRLLPPATPAGRLGPSSPYHLLFSQDLEHLLLLPTAPGCVYRIPLPAPLPLLTACQRYIYSASFGTQHHLPVGCYSLLACLLPGMGLTMQAPTCRLHRCCCTAPLLCTAPSNHSLLSTSPVTCCLPVGTGGSAMEILATTGPACLHFHACTGWTHHYLLHCLLPAWAACHLGTCCLPACRRPAGSHAAGRTVLPHCRTCLQHCLCRCLPACLCYTLWTAWEGPMGLGQDTA